MTLNTPAFPATETLDLSALGLQVILHAPADGEDALTFDVVGRPRGFLVQAHVHDTQEERLEVVISGEMEIVIGRRRHRLRPGDQFTIAPGEIHRQRPAGAGEGHVRVSVRPAGRTEEFLRRLAALAGEGAFTRGGFPRPTAAALLIRDYSDTGHPPIPLHAQMLGAKAILAAARLWREYAFVDEWTCEPPPRTSTPRLPTRAPIRTGGGRCTSA